MKRMMMRIFYTAIFSLFFIYQDGAAQIKKWTLEDCINYAVSNNIGLKRQRLQTETAQASLTKSKMDLLPSLNMGSDVRVGFGRSIDPVTNLITFEQNLSNSYSINTNFSLFRGFATLNTIASNRFMYMAGLEQEKIAQNTLIIEILGQYYQVLYANGLEEASKMQLDLSEKQNFRVSRMVETGKEALSRQYEMESQLSSDRLSYTVAANNTSKALTTLKQLLQVDPESDFELLIPNPADQLVSDESYKPDSIYQIASQTLPRLKAIEFELLSSRKQISAARGLLVPSISMGGSVFTGYYKLLSDSVPGQIAFSNQLKNNNSQALFLSLDIPIFNNYSTGRSIRNAKIRKNDNELRLLQERNSLYTEIENACLDYTRGKDEYLAARANLEFNKKSFAAVEKKFEAGLVDVTDYSAAKTTLFRAEAEALRTKLQIIIRKLSINFYTTGEYKKIIFN
jgi:outer membrane protein